MTRARYRPESGAVLDVTRITRERWRAAARCYPALGADPGPRAVAARRRLWYLTRRALSSARHGPRWEGDVPPNTPALYATAHIGDIRVSRHILRQRGIRVAQVIGPNNLEREPAEAEDRRFDTFYPIDFPHVFPSSNPRRLIRALSQGSLVVAIDLPAGRSISVPFLGGRLTLDPKPLRLATIARVPIRALFLTAPAERLTLTVGPELDPADEESTIARIGELIGRVAAASPYDFDAFTHRWRF